MDRILFGDNQFFGINHMSEEKSRKQEMQFQKTEAIIDVLDYMYEIGLRTFMCTTHERIGEICDHIRNNPDKYKGFKMYPCMPYAHKYNNAVAELGLVEALKKMIPGSLIKAVARGGLAFAKKDYEEIMKLLVDAEMKMFSGINTEVIFLQNVATDLLLGMEMEDFFVFYYNYIKEKYNAEAGFITMNLPRLKKVLIKRGITKPIICASINKIGFRMPGGCSEYEKSIVEGDAHIIAMQVLAAGAIKPQEALKYVTEKSGIQSILYGASTKKHILETKELIELYSNGTV